MTGTVYGVKDKTKTFMDQDRQDQLYGVERLR